MYEYDPNKVSMSRLRLAYKLNDHEVEIVMAKLWPHALFPLELWRKTHEMFWSGFANSVALFYSIKSPEFPEHNVAEEKYFHAHLYAQDMENLFSMLASRIHVNALREGLRYIVSMTYENTDEISFKDKMDLLFEKLSRIEENNEYRFTQRLSNEKFIALMEEKIFSFPPTRYFFVSKMYPDTILVDTVSAIRCLHFLNIPFKKEVKGITRALVKKVLAELHSENSGVSKPLSAAPQSLSAGVSSDTGVQEPQDVIFVQRSLWAGKNKETICTNMRNEGLANEYIAHVLLHKRGLTLTQRELGELLGEPHKSEATYDKLGKKLVKEAALVSVLDAPEPEHT